MNSYERLQNKPFTAKIKRLSAWLYKYHDIKIEHDKGSLSEGLWHVKDVYDTELFVSASFDDCVNYLKGMAQERFSAKLRAALDASGLTQKAFAESLGIPLRTLENWLSGKNTPPEFTQASVLQAAKAIRKEQ